MIKEFALRLRADPIFKEWVKELKKELRPVIPAYTPAASVDSEALLLNRIKWETARRAGFDVLMAALTGEPHGRADD